MRSIDVVVSRKIVLDAETVTIFIKEASKYKSEIWVQKDGKKANAKSLLGMFSLGLVVGCKLTISAEGEDEYEAVKKMEELVVGN